MRALEAPPIDEESKFGIRSPVLDERSIIQTQQAVFSFSVKGCFWSTPARAGGPVDAAARFPTLRSPAAASGS
jgi:hypothetical protein